jgi:hypothetical protein
MRLLALSILVCFVLVAAVGPVAAQNVTPVVTITNSGTITSCPATVNFSAAITVSGLSLSASRQLQYKFLNSSGQDAPTQTLNVPIGTIKAGGHTTLMPMLAQTVTATGSWTVGAGTYWEDLQISYPVNQTSPHLGFVVTCPTSGSITPQQSNLIIVPRAIP